MTENTAPVENAIPSFSGRVVKLAKQILSERNEFLSSKNLLPGHDDFLLAAHANEGITMGALAELLDITPSSTTKIAVKMETAKLLRREASRLDSRQHHAFLTGTGAELATEIIAAYAALDEMLTKAVKTKETERAFKLFDRLEGNPDSVGKKPKKAGKKKAVDELEKKSGKKKKSRK